MTTAPSPIDERRGLENLLHWYVAMGVDVPVDEAPHDRFGALQAPPPPRRLPETGARELPPIAPPRPGDAPASADALIREAQALADGAENLADLAARWATLPGCGLAATASRMIFAAGTSGAPLMLIGGAPEADDERQGEAFAGPRGRLLDAMLAAIGVDRTRVYLANVVPWRPPGARPPTPLELGLCLPFARRHIALAAPKILVCLGERAGQPLLATTEPISRLRGRWHTHEGDTATVRTLVTFTPDYLLKQPLQKRQAWADLRMLADALEPSP